MLFRSKFWGHFDRIHFGTVFEYGSPDLFDLAAAYGHGLVKNHPFIDGNKRIGFMAATLFLELNGLH